MIQPIVPIWILAALLKKRRSIALLGIGDVAPVGDGAQIARFVFVAGRRSGLLCFARRLLRRDPFFRGFPLLRPLPKSKKRLTETAFSPEVSARSSGKASVEVFDPGELVGIPPAGGVLAAAGSVIVTPSSS